MTLEDFVNSTINVVRQDGVDEYLPTLLLPDADEFQVIEGIPHDVDHRDAIQRIVSRSGLEKREFFFGVKSGPGRITAGHFRPGEPTTFMDIEETPDGYSTVRVQACNWWHTA